MTSTVSGPSNAELQKLVQKQNAVIEGLNEILAEREADAREVDQEHQENGNLLVKLQQTVKEASTAIEQLLEKNAALSADVQKLREEQGGRVQQNHNLLELHNNLEKSRLEVADLQRQLRDAERRCVKAEHEHESMQQKLHNTRKLAEKDRANFEEKLENLMREFAEKSLLVDRAEEAKLEAVTRSSLTERTLSQKVELLELRCQELQQESLRLARQKHVMAEQLQKTLIEMSEQGITRPDPRPAASAVDAEYETVILGQRAMIGALRAENRSLRDGFRKPGSECTESHSRSGKTRHRKPVDSAIDQFLLKLP